MFGKNKNEDEEIIKRVTEDGKNVKIANIDILEMEKQRKKSMIESGEFIRVEIVISPIEKTYSHVDCCKVSENEIAEILVEMNNVKKSLVAICPPAESIAKRIISDKNTKTNKNERGK